MNYRQIALRWGRIGWRLNLGLESEGRVETLCAPASIWKLHLARCAFGFASGTTQSAEISLSASRIAIDAPRSAPLVGTTKHSSHLATIQHAVSAGLLPPNTALSVHRILSARAAVWAAPKEEAQHFHIQLVRHSQHQSGGLRGKNLCPMSATWGVPVFPSTGASARRRTSFPSPSRPPSLPYTTEFPTVGSYDKIRMLQARNPRSEVLITCDPNCRIFCENGGGRGGLG